MYIIRYFLIALLLPVFFVSCKELKTGKIGSCYYRSKDKIYYLTRQKSGKIDSLEMPNANARFFEIVYDELPGDDCFNSNIWAKDKSNVWYKNLRLPGADPATFRVLENGYSKDEHYAYYLNFPLSVANTEEFESLGWFYAKTHSRIWYCGKEVSGIRKIESFKVIDSYFSCDTNQVYLFKDSIFVAIAELNRTGFHCLDDQNTFRYTNLKWYTNSEGNYFIDTEALIGSQDFLFKSDSSSDSLIILKEKFFYKDAYHVYFKDEIIEGADPKTFEPLGNSYGRDTESVYYQSRKLNGVNPGTFICISNDDKSDAKSGTISYLKGRKI